MDQKSRLLHGLLELFENNLLVDLTISCADETVLCHKNVLAASSPYFRAMFTSDVKENENGQLKITDTSPHVLRQVVAYCYHGNIDITNENVQDIFMTANMFEMLTLRDMCAEYMVGELHQSNCIQVYQFADLYSCQLMKEKAWSHILENFTVVSQSTQVSLLSFEDISCLLTSDDLYIDNEELVFKACVNWVKANIDERKSYFTRLFGCVRLGLLTKEFLAETVSSEPLIRENAVLRSHVAMAKLCSISRDLESEVPMFDVDVNSSKRLGMFNTPMIVFAGGGIDGDCRSLCGYDPSTARNHFAIKPHINFDNRFRIDMHQLVVAPGNQIYIIGGIYYVDHHFEDEAQALDEMKLFDHRKKSWIPKPKLPQPRCAFAAVCVDNAIYVMGGKSIYPSGDILDSVTAYNISDEKWCLCAPMPLKLCHHRAVADADADSIYVLGGMIEDNLVTDTLLHYDVHSDVWTMMNTHMKCPRAEFGAALFNGKIWIMGGSDGTHSLSSTEMYVIESGRWRCGPDFLEERKSPNLLVLNDVLYSYGGVRTIQLPNRAARVLESKDLSRLDNSYNQWQRLVKNVQYGNMYGCVVAQLNVRWLTESGYTS